MNKTEEPAIEHFDLLVGRICESFDAVFSRYLSFRFLYRHSGSTDMFFMFFHVHSGSQTLKNVTHVVTCTVDFLIVCGHGFPFSIFHFRHVELQPCHTMCISLQGTTAVRRQKHHRLEHRLPWFRRCDPKVRSDLLVNDCCFFVGDRIPKLWSGFLNFIQLDFSFVIELNLILD